MQVNQIETKSYYNISQFQNKPSEKGTQNNCIANPSKDPLIGQVERGEADHDNKVLNSLTKEQLSMLTSLKIQTLTKILPNPYSSEKSQTEMRERLNCLDKNLICKMTEEGKLDDHSYLLQALSKEHLAALKMLTSKTLTVILPNPYSSEKSQTELRERLHCMDNNLICKMIEEGKLDDRSYLLQALSKEHLTALKMLTSKTLAIILPNPYSSEKGQTELCERLNCLDKNLICKMTEEGKLDDHSYLLQALSKEHLATLKTLTSKRLTIILPNPYQDLNSQTKLYERLNCLDKNLICKMTEEGKLDNHSYLLQALSKEHLAALKTLTSKTLTIILPNPYESERSQTELRERLNCLDKNLICKMTEEGKLDDHSYLLQTLSKEHLATLKKLTSKTLTIILPNPYSSEKDQTELRERLNCLDKNLICKMTEEGKLDDHSYLLQALSKEHLATLKTLTSKRLTIILPNPYQDLNSQTKLYERLNCLDKNLICKMTEEGKLDNHSYLLQALSKEHLAALKTLTSKTLTIILPNPYESERSQTELRERLNCLDKNLICKMTEEGKLDDHSYLLQILSKEHLATLKKLTSKTLTLILPNPYDDRNKANLLTERYRHLDWTLVREHIEGNEELSSHLLLLLPVERLKLVNFSNLPQSKINKFFPLCDLETFKLSYSYVSLNGDGIKVRIPLYPDNELKKMADMQKQKNEELLAKLTPAQQKEIFPRLYIKLSHSPDDNVPFMPYQPKQFNDHIPPGFKFKFPFAEPANHSHYATLGLPVTATEEIIKKQFHKLALQYHSDKLHKKDSETEKEFEERKALATAQFQKISTAYEELIKKSKN